MGELAESFEAVSDLVSELFLESAFEKGHDDPENESQSESKTKRPSTVQTEKIFTDVIKQPLPGELNVKVDLFTAGRSGAAACHF